MKRIFIIWCFFISVFLIKADGQVVSYKTNIAQRIDTISAFKDTLNSLSMRSDNDFFKMHCNSIIRVINSRTVMPVWEGELIIDMYNAFNNEADTCNPKVLSTYIKRRRPFILSWISPTDSCISDALIKPPKNWDPDKEYPLYVRLHGQTGDAQSPIKYMANPYITKASNDSSFDDGYLLSPWGRGNSMYINNAETDVWQCIDAFEAIAKIDPSRKYLVGLSMGGYGTWHIGLKSPNKWAAFGIYAGVLAYNASELTLEAAKKIKDVPTYIICGTKDQLFPSNQTGYNLLVEAGDTNVEFFTFEGDHEFYSEYIGNMYLWIRNFVNDDWYISDIENRQMTSEQSRIYCYPNPFSSHTVIGYNLEKDEYLSLEVYNDLGQLTEILINTKQLAGKYEIDWAPKNQLAGVYYCLLKTEDSIETIKVIIR
jgi:predicted esterase